jgi:hypothetical protein
VSYRIWAVIYGLYIWVQATLTIRWFGSYIFLPNEPAIMAGVFLVTVGMVYGAAYFFYKMFALTAFQRADAAILICAAGLVADIPVFLYWHIFFPDLSTALTPWVAAWIMWGYGIGILTGVVPRHLPGLPQE